MDDQYAKNLLLAAAKCDTLTRRENEITTLARQVIDGSSSIAKMSLLWKISDISNSEEALRNAGLREAIQELNNSLMHFHNYE